MNKALFLAATLALSGLTLAQTGTKLDKPLSESDLLNRIDGIGTGDPLKKAPLSIGNATGAEKPAEPKKEEKKALKGMTEITSNNANYDQKGHQAFFAGAVTVMNPEFKIVCDKLTVFLKDDGKGTKPTAKAAGTPPPKTTPPPAAPVVGATPAPKKDGKGAGGMERAIAEALEGKRVIITQEKVEADGSISYYQGKAEKADYNATSGEVVLTGWPEVQQGINSSVATDRGTIMYLNRDGRLRTEGPSKIKIKDSGPEPANAR